MRRPMAIAAGVGLALGLGFGACRTLAQQGVVQRVGQKLDGVGRTIKDGAVELDESIRRKFDTVRADVHRMGAAHRVYARIHWDKELHSSKVEVHPIKGGGVLLRGTVPTDEARKRAVALATDTVDVTSVIDELTTLSPAASAPAGPSAPARR